MHTISTRTTAFLFLSVFITLSAYAEEQTVKVINQDGLPVVDAIVSFESDTPMLSSDSSDNMEQTNMQFSPKVLIVPKGQRVYFPNKDSTRHHVYSFSKPKPFEIKLYKGIPQEPLVFDIPGMVVLGCNIHDGMVGYIYVTDNEIARLTNTQGISTFTEILPKTVTVWHADNTDGKRGRSTLQLEPDSNSNTWLAKINTRQAPIKKANTFKSRFGR